ncbi:MAG TPA: hypothetical protein VLF95_04930 [Vicinamibacteria bacterium]|nr:hypothetical protein [Vicinamibacteria bacterium]
MARLTAWQQERTAALRLAPPAPESLPFARTPAGEALAMLRRRGFRPKPWPPDLPFPPGFDEARRDLLGRRLDHYAFRLFLRGAIQHAAGFRPSEATRYVEGPAARAMAEELTALGLAERVGRSRYRLLHPPRSFGGTLEWYLARELAARLGFDTATALRFGAPGVGGDLDVVAAAEGRLVYVEAKSSPPRQISEEEVRAFFDRLEALRPDLALFVVDTALRLGDKVVPMLAGEAARRARREATPRRVVREVWRLTPRLYAVGAKGHLSANLAAAVAEGLRALVPPVL